MSSIQRLVGQMLKPGQAPENVEFFARTNDPLGYKIRNLVVSSVSGTLTLDIAQAQSFSCTLTEAVTTIDVNGPMVANEYWEFFLTLIQDSTPRAVTWASKFLFPGGTDHVVSTGSGAVDVLHCWTIDGGTTWNCTFAQAFA